MKNLLGLFLIVSFGCSTYDQAEQDLITQASAPAEVLGLGCYIVDYDMDTGLSSVIPCEGGK